MCLIFFALDQHPDYQLIIAGNRDESYNRQTASAGFWDEHPHVLAGRDLEAMGTWLGMTRAGKVSMLTNYRDLSQIRSAAPSRGHLVSDYLINEVDPYAYMRKVEQKGVEYNGFNLLAGTPDELWYYSNFGGEPQKITKGVFGLSNHLLDSPWPKVIRGKDAFSAILKQKEIQPDMLFHLLSNEEVAEDSLLPNTGLPLEMERALSSMFIKTTGYGSRSSTVILVDRQNKVYFSERVYDLETFQSITGTFEFSIGG